MGNCFQCLQKNEAEQGEPFILKTAQSSLRASPSSTSFNNGRASTTDETGLYSQTINLKDFEIEKVIGRGSFGKVYMVRKRDNGKIYAMKVLKKEAIQAKKQKVHTKAEREILERIKNPFIVQLHYAFQTPDKLYFIVDFLNGGELFYHLKKETKFPESRARFYAAEIILALECLHSRNIIYRDLKPENVLLDGEGHIKITDFGLSKQGVGTKKTYTFCGTPEYLAPEIIQGVGHDKAVDWWSLGALLYEMLSGKPPFYSKNRGQMLRNIVERQVEMRPYFSPEAKSLLTALLQTKPNKRLGSSPADAEEIKQHPFFSSIDWEKLYRKQMDAPYKPMLNSQEDTSNIDKMFLNEKPRETPIDSHLNLNQKAANKFEDFTYKRDDMNGMEGFSISKNRID